MARVQGTVVPMPRPGEQILYTREGQAVIVRGEALEMTDEEAAEAAEVDALVDKPRQRSGAEQLASCGWCMYGKPAVAGAVLGAVGAMALGQEPMRGVLWGGIGGLGYGVYRANTTTKKG